jgi:TIR domain
MYSLASRRWFFPTVLALVVLAELLVARANWPVDTHSDPNLRRMHVPTGNELVVQQPASEKVQPILTYNGTPRHNHRVTLDMHSARLSDETLRLLAAANPPKTAGRVIYGPDPNEKAKNGASCLNAFRLELPASATAEGRSVEIAPRAPGDYQFDPSVTRLVHVASPSPLAVRVSANSPDGSDGPGCRNLLSIGSWQQVIGKDLEMALVADARSPINVNLAVDADEPSDHKTESLRIEDLLPERLYIRPMSVDHVLQSRKRAGKPLLTVTDLRLGGDLLDVELSGKAAVPIPELLGWTKWPIVLLVDLPLLACAIAVFRLKKTIFISYSWRDRARVQPICDRLKQAGIPIWIDCEVLKPGDDWEEIIREQIRKCRHIVFFLSNSVNDGGFLLTELALARATAKDRFKRTSFVIPVRLEPCAIPSILSPWNALDLFERDNERHLFEALGVRSAGQVQTSSAVSVPVEP